MADDLKWRVDELEHKLSQLQVSHDQSVARLQEQLSLARHAPTAGGSSTNSLAQTAGAVLGQRVEWTIPRIQDVLRDKEKGASIYSPSFDVAGIQGIQIEFYPRGRTTNNQDDAAKSHTGGNAPSPAGFCSLFLWCPQGTHIRYFLFCNNYKRAPDEDKFESRMGHGHSNFCILEEQIDKEADSVTVGVEIVEVLNRNIDLAPDIKLSWPSLSELVRKEMEVKLHEHVERVEWQVKNIREIVNTWGKGSSLFSPLFTAAGVRDILFEFYPNGSAVTTTDGFCGFYIRCPDGTSVTLTLFVGTVKKGPISAKFEHAAGKGLPDFCRLEDQIDANTDSITVGIEIRNNDLPMSRTLRI